MSDRSHIGHVEPTEQASAFEDLFEEGQERQKSSFSYSQDISVLLSSVHTYVKRNSFHVSLSLFFIIPFTETE